MSDAQCRVFESPLLALVWPKERVLAGMQVSKYLREQLPNHADAVVIRLAKRKNPKSNAVKACEVKRDMQQISQRFRRIELTARDHEKPTFQMCWQSRSLVLQEAVRALPAIMMHSLTCLDMALLKLGEEGTKEVCRAVASCTALTSLDLSSNGSLGDSCALLASTIPSCQALQTLLLRSTRLGSHGMRQVLKAVSLCSQLNTLDLSWNARGASEELSDVLGECTGLTDLTLEGNGITGVFACPQVRSLRLAHNALDGRALRQILQSAPHLRNVEVGFNGLGDAGLCEMAPGLTTCTALTSIAAEGNFIGVAGATALHGGLSQRATLLCCCNLTKLALPDNNLEAKEGVEALVAGIQSAHVRLSELDLTACKMTSRGATALAEAFRQGRVPLELRLGENAIEDEGAASIARALAGSSRLQRLSLRNNCLGQEGAEEIAVAAQGNGIRDAVSPRRGAPVPQGAAFQSFARALATCNGLLQLDLGHNRLGHAGIAAVEAVLASCQNLAQLGLDATGIDDRAAELLARGLMEGGGDARGVTRRSKLRELSATENAFGPAGLRHLCSALAAHHRALEVLDLSRNRLADTDPVAESVAVLVAGCPWMRQLDLHECAVGDVVALALSRARSTSPKKPTWGIRFSLQGNQVTATTDARFAL